MRVTVVAGVMAGVEKESLELYFTELAKGTPAEGAELGLKRAAAKLVCVQCGGRTEYDNQGDLAVQCTLCGGNNRLEGGNELYIESMEIEQ